MTLAFTKMHGLGNDFVVIDALTQRVRLEPEQIRRMADRHTGVGFDQLLLVEPPTDPDADFRYRIFNPDGEEAEQCGNGARCFARFVVDQGLTVKREIVLQTVRGHIECRLCDDGQVEVDLGAPRFEPQALPFDVEAARTFDGVEATLDVEGETVAGVPVSMGNPHFVVFVDDVTTAPVGALGPALQRHAAFPRSVNVGFCRVVDPGFLRLRVFERGAGETSACGSGACAAFAAAVRTDRAAERAKMSLPGGKLRLSWSPPDGGIRMRGSACKVFEGRIEP